MSYFYGFLKGQRGQATRCGSKLSGICATVKSWINTVTINLHADSEGNDILYINIPNGLNTRINGIDFDAKKQEKLLDNRLKRSLK